MDVLALDKNPFEGYKISDKWKSLHSLEERSICPKCKKSRKYFCYTCYVPVLEIVDYVPAVELPCKVDVIKHCREIDGKSTAAHAAVIASKYVTIHTYPNIPKYTSEDKVILVFPSKNAVSLEEMIIEMTRHRSSTTEEKIAVPFTRVVFIDSTWNQCRGIYKDPRIQGLPCVVLKSRISQFWRHQKGSPRWHLATVEAIHQFFVELQIIMKKLNYNSRESDQTRNFSNDCNQPASDSEPIYDGEYDDLLFFFRFMYDKIHNLYDHDTLRSYKRPLQ